MGTIPKSVSGSSRPSSAAASGPRRVKSLNQSHPIFQLPTKSVSENLLSNTLECGWLGQSAAMPQDSAYWGFASSAASHPSPLNRGNGKIQSDDASSHSKQWRYFMHY